jgi:uncharacterized protein YukE
VVTTNFAALDEPTLLRMLHRGAPDIVEELADAWGVLAVQLQERGHDMEMEHARLDPTWTGPAAQQYAASLRQTIQVARRVADMAAGISDIMHANAASLEMARTMHPAPPEVVGEVPERPRVYGKLKREATA